MSYIVDDDVNHQLRLETLLKDILDELKLIRVILLEGTGVEISLKDVEHE